MTVNASHIHGEVVSRRHGFQAVPHNTKLQHRYLHRLEYGDTGFVGIMPKGVSLPVEASSACFRFIPDYTVDRPPGVTTGEMVGNRTNNLASVRSSLRSAA